MLIFRTFIQTINGFAFFVIKGIARKQLVLNCASRAKGESFGSRLFVFG